MDAIINWVKQIFVLSIVSNIIIQLMPSSKYEQHAKFICGIILAAACITPVISYLAKEDIFMDTYHALVDFQDVQELKNELKYNSSSDDDAIIEEYQNKIEEDIDQRVLDEGLYPCSTSVYIDSDEESSTYGSIQVIDLVVSFTKTTKTTDSSSEISIGQISVGQVSVGQSSSNSSSTQIDNSQILELKNTLADFYNLNITNINISINRE